MPHCIYTELGKWRIVGSCSFNTESPTKLFEKLIERLGLVVYTPQRNTQMGSYGPIYKITKIDDKELGEPIMKKHDDYISYEEANKKWNEIMIIN